MSQAESFLRFFEGVQTFQSFDDRGQDKSLARHNSADFEDIEAKLLEINKRGAGIFFTVNETDGKGRKAENITRVRAVFVDLDGSGARERLAQVLSAKAAPSVVVESSPEKFHCYWLVADCPLEKFSAVQKALAARFGGDPAVNDLARVMRLPGFYHNKKDPFLSRIIQADGQTYALAEVIRGLDLQPPSTTEAQPVPHKITGFSEGNRNESMFKYACSLRARGVAVEEAAVLLKAQAQLCKPPFEYREVMSVLAQAYKYREGTTAQQAEPGEEGKKKKLAEATRDDFFELFERVLGPLPRDIFSGCCMTFEDDLWLPAGNFLPRVKSEAHFLETSKVRRYNRAAIDDHFAEYQARKTKRLIPEIPQWDGEDRITAIAECCLLDGTQQLPANATSVFFKAWLAGIFRKLDDPGYQNPVLILKGPQGIGKDVLIDTLTGGLQQWAKDLTLSHNDKDNYIQLSNAAVLKIGEFERTSRTDIATIKDMIFRKFTYIRPSYKPEFRDAQCRASFVASCNTDDFYRDPTGNRRFVVFNLSKIEWGYPINNTEYQRQLLAQAQQLAAEKYAIPPMHLHAMAEFLAGKTPDSPEVVTCEIWETLVADWADQNPALGIEVMQRGWISNTDAVKYGVFERVARALGVNLRLVRSHLTASNYGARRKVNKEATRGYLVSRARGAQPVTDEGTDDFI